MLEYSITIKLLTKQHLEFLRFKGGCTGSSEYNLSKCHIVWNHMSRLKYNCTLDFSSYNIKVFQLFNYFVCLFDLILYITSTIFHLNRDGSSWVEPVLSKDKFLSCSRTTMQWPQWGSNPGPLGLESSTLPLSYYVSFFNCTNTCLSLQIMTLTALIEFANYY